MKEMVFQVVKIMSKQKRLSLKFFSALTAASCLLFSTIPAKAQYFSSYSSYGGLGSYGSLGGLGYGGIGYGGLGGLGYGGLGGLGYGGFGYSPYTGGISNLYFGQALVNPYYWGGGYGYGGYSNGALLASSIIMGASSVASLGLNLLAQNRANKAYNQQIQLQQQQQQLQLQQQQMQQQQQLAMSGWNQQTMSAAIPAGGYPQMNIDQNFNPVPMNFNNGSTTYGSALPPSPAPNFR
ncbi:MAG: hypothetical protein K2W82_17690 [Candidatus Obscuribacterales bacterium]|nr:hypothetical protein [Candidatus Obscuribacterales bacterium]